MYYIADLHVHSRYAYATSKGLDLESLYEWALIKGIDVVGTGDFTHPLWVKELKEKLVPAGNGFYQLKELPREASVVGMRPKKREVYFCLSAEVSCIYSYGGRVRKSHHLIYAPDLEKVEELNRQLAKIGNLSRDGRPILGISARDLLRIVLEVSEECYLIPAHIWTPWFSIFGAKSGYDRVEECFRDLSEYIFALETGLSSDPTMNWRISGLDKYTLVSNSDAHSAKNLGREANCLDGELSYADLFSGIKTRNGFLGTLEFFPEEGKYHYDGHRDCGVSFAPTETMKHDGICPVCGGGLTIGVRHRVEKLADRTVGESQGNGVGFRYIVPLPEIISQIAGKGVNTKCVGGIYRHIINLFGDEFSFLSDVSLEDIRRELPLPYGVAIERLRAHEVRRTPGYDGRYGTIHLWDGEENSLGDLLN